MYFKSSCTCSGHAHSGQPAMYPGVINRQIPSPVIPTLLGMHLCWNLSPMFCMKDAYNVWPFLCSFLLLITSSLQWYHCKIELKVLIYFCLTLGFGKILFILLEGIQNP